MQPHQDLQIMCQEGRSTGYVDWGLENSILLIDVHCLASHFTTFHWC